MKKCNVLRIAFGLLFLGLAFLSWGQSNRQELESQRKALEKQIKATSETLKKTQKGKTRSLSQLKALNTQMKQRQELLAAINRELNQVKEEAELQEKNTVQTSKAIAQLESRLEHALRNAYLRIQLQPDWIYLLSAQSISQALSRWVYLRQYKSYVTGQLKALKEKKELHQKMLAELEQNRKAKTLLAQKEEEHKREILKEQQEQESLLKKFGSEEKRLKKDLANTEARKKKLDAEIARLIKAETEKVTSSGLLTAPEIKALNDQFAGNKGKLPWPVGKGLITGKFGNHPHPVLKGIMVQNNGIDIRSEPGAVVKSLFNGTVASVTRIPGYDYMVMVRHGLYFTVYSKLSKVSVKKGDAVKTGQTIGQLGSEEPDLHLEIWKDKTKLNPETWIARK